MTPDILCERDGPIETVTLFNPDKPNAVTAAMWQRFKSVMDKLAADDTLRCIILRGEGRAFASGRDIAEFLTLRDNFAFLDSADCLEGLAAFFAKHSPRFTGA